MSRPETFGMTLVATVQLTCTC